MNCDRHPLAVLQAGLCPACLLESALATPRHTGDVTGAFTIHLPLGDSASAAVFLVRDQRPDGRLLRLKVWRWPAPVEFLERFRELQQQLGDWSDARVALPIAAYVDAAGCPAVLTEFRQGIPIVEGVKAGSIAPQQAQTMLRLVIEVMRIAHTRGLVHGAMVAGNVIAHPRTGVAHLLDFGLAAVVSPITGRSALPADDRAALAALLRAVRGCTRIPPAGRGRL